VSAFAPIWMLRLVLPGRIGRLASFFLLLFVLLFSFHAAGMFEPLEGVTPAAAVFFAVIIAYIVPVFHFITEHTVRAFDQLSVRLDANEHLLARWRSGIASKTRRAQLLAVGLGIVGWVAHTTLLYGSWERVVVLTSDGLTYVMFLLAPLLVWVTMVSVVTALVQNAILFRRLAARARVDLVDTAPLTAFGRVAVISTLALVGAQSAFPILWFDSDRALAASLPGLLATSLAMLALFVLPIWPIHHAVATKKKLELARITELIDAERAALERDPTDSRQAIVRLAPYLVYRREIAAVNDWPFDSNIVSRLAFYLFIPPLTWLGAAFIDVAVERLL
jgi:hypothetical protein